MNRYSALERKLATTRDATLFQVLKRTFEPDSFLQTESDGKSIGTLGARMGSIAELLGVTMEDSKKLARMAAARRRKRSQTDLPDAADRKSLLQELADLAD